MRQKYQIKLETDRLTLVQVLLLKLQLKPINIIRFMKVYNI